MAASTQMPIKRSKMKKYHDQCTARKGEPWQTIISWNGQQLIFKASSFSWPCMYGNEWVAAFYLMFFWYINVKLKLHYIVLTVQEGSSQWKPKHAHKCMIMYCIYKILLYSHVYVNIDINLYNVQFRHWNLLKVLHWKTVPKQKVEKFKFFKILWSAFKIITAVSTGSARPHAYSTPERYRTLYALPHRSTGRLFLSVLDVIDFFNLHLR